MFHIFTGEKKNYGSKVYIENTLGGIQVQYSGNQSKGTFFIYPYLDDNAKTIKYYAFDTYMQKQYFEDMLKISGIGPKTAFQIAQIPSNQLQQAIKELDVKFFQSIPGIGPKSAKKLLLELKGSFSVEDMQGIDIDQKLFKDICKSLKNFGYDTDKVKTVLQSYPEKVTKEKMSEVIKRVIGNM